MLYSVIFNNVISRLSGSVYAAGFIYSINLPTGGKTIAEKRAYWAEHAKNWKTSGESRRSYACRHNLHF